MPEPTPTVFMQEQAGELWIRCPTLLAYHTITNFLTFHRKIGTGRSRCPEYCYHPWPGVPFGLVCSPGFREMMFEHFEKKFAFRYQVESQEPQPATSIASETISSISFRPGQKEILEKMFANDRGRILVPPAVGKSFLIARYAEIRSQERIVITTFSRSVLLQLYENIRRNLGDEIGLMTSGRTDRPDARVVCVGQKKLARFLAEQSSARIETVVIDEFHEWGTKRILTLLEQLPPCKRFGLSASRSRTDGAEFRLAGLLGPVLADMEYGEAARRKLVTPIEVVWVPFQTLVESADMISDRADRERSLIWRHSARNRTVAKIARSFGDQEQVLISVRTIEHAIALQEILPDFTIVHASKRNAFGPSRTFMTPGRLEILRSQFATGTLKKAIATGVWSRGVDFPELRVLVRADAMNSCIADLQWPGRTARTRSGKDRSLIFDFSDEHDPILAERARQRADRYEQQGFRQLVELRKMPDSDIL